MPSPRPPTASADEHQGEEPLDLDRALGRAPAGDEERGTPTLGEFLKEALYVAKGPADQKRVSLFFKASAVGADALSIVLAQDAAARVLFFDVDATEAIRVGEFLTDWGRTRRGDVSTGNGEGGAELTASTLLDDVPEHLLYARKVVDDLWYALEQACSPKNEKRHMPRGECRRSGRQAVYELLQAISAAEGDLAMAHNLLRNEQRRAAKARASSRKEASRG